MFCYKGLRTTIANVVMSYSPLWLRIGLETILGEAIQLTSPKDTQTLKVLSTSFAAICRPMVY